MATQEQIDYVLDYWDKSQPANFFKKMNEGNAGIGAVLRILYESPESVTSGYISEFMQVGTARTAVLLKKMSDKGLITKSGDIKDARRTIVSLTDDGRDTVRNMRDDLRSKISAVIDKLGMDKITEFLEISNEMKSVFSPPDIEF